MKFEKIVCSLVYAKELQLWGFKKLAYFNYIETMHSVYVSPASELPFDFSYIATPAFTTDEFFGFLAHKFSTFQYTYVNEFHVIHAGGFDFNNKSTPANACASAIIDLIKLGFNFE